MIRSFDFDVESFTPTEERVTPALHLDSTATFDGFVRSGSRGTGTRNYVAVLGVTSHVAGCGCLATAVCRLPPVASLYTRVTCDATLRFCHFFSLDVAFPADAVFGCYGYAPRCSCCPAASFEVSNVTSRSAAASGRSAMASSLLRIQRVGSTAYLPTERVEQTIPNFSGFLLALRCTPTLRAWYSSKRMETICSQSILSNSCEQINIHSIMSHTNA